VFGNSGAVVGIDLNLDCVKDQAKILFGPTTVQRQGASDASTNFPGAIGSSGDSHIDVIDTFRCGQGFRRSTIRVFVR